MFREFRILEPRSLVWLVNQALFHHTLKGFVLHRAVGVEEVNQSKMPHEGAETLSAFQVTGHFR